MVRVYRAVPHSGRLESLYIEPWLAYDDPLDEAAAYVHGLDLLAEAIEAQGTKIYFNG